VKRRFLAALTGVVLAALWATPAFAQSEPRFLQAPGSGTVASGSPLIRVESQPAAVPIVGMALEKVFIQVTVRPRSGTGGSATAFPKKEGSIYEVNWNAGGADYNGAYDIVAVATTPSDETGKSATVGNVLVNNPPSTPTGVRAELKDGVPSVRWNASPEPDVIGYRVLRSADGKESQVYAGSGTSFSDTSAPHSQALTYKVSAFRKSPVSEGGIESSKASSGSVTVPAPPPPAEPSAEGEPSDPNNPTVPGTNIVTGKETPKAPALGTNKNFGKAVAPIVKSAPAGTAFEPTLPYDGTPPENFNAASGGDPSLLDAATADEGVSVTNPIRFLVGGLILAAASVFLWRASRKLLVGTRPEDQISPHRVNFPAFRINRG
jgi:hypothetical protein